MATVVKPLLGTAVVVDGLVAVVVVPQVIGTVDSVVH